MIPEIEALIADCDRIMAAANNSGRDLIDIELAAIKANAAEADRIRARHRQTRHISSKVEIRDILRSAGLAKTAAERIDSAGWPALSPENAAAEAVTRISAAAAKLRSD